MKLGRIFSAISVNVLSILIALPSEHQLNCFPVLGSYRIGNRKASPPPDILLNGLRSDCDFTTSFRYAELIFLLFEREAIFK